LIVDGGIDARLQKFLKRIGPLVRTMRFGAPLLEALKNGARPLRTAVIGNDFAAL
jgi:hypothetical protein